MKKLVRCPNGHKLSVGAKLAGKRVKCPKCGAVVRIPELSDFDPDESKQSASVQPPPKPGPSVQPPEDLFGSSDSESDSWDEEFFDDSEAGDEGAWGDEEWDDVPEAPALPPRPNRKKTKRAAPKPVPPQKPSTALVASLVGGGAVFGFLFVCLLGWMLFGGSSDEPNVVDSAQISGPEGAAGQTEASTDPEALTNVPVVQPDSASGVMIMPDPGSFESPQAESKDDKPSEPPRQPQPFELVRLNMDERVDGFKLPEKTWAAAYDVVTGRLAITNDEKGILIYDIDDILKGQAVPEAILPTQGLPAAVCLKPLPEKRAFVIASQDDPHLILIDADSLQPFGRVPLNDLKHVDFMTGSQNPDDPFVYYSTPDQREDPSTANRLVRINLVTGTQDAPSATAFVDVTVSPDGGLLYPRTNSTASGPVGTWDQIQSFQGRYTATGARSGQQTGDKAPPFCFGAWTALDNRICTATMAAILARLDYTPAVQFSRRPVLLGLGKTDIVFGSANDFRRLASIPLPQNWLRTDRRPDPQDFRTRYSVSPIVRSGFFDIKVDDERNLGLLIFGEHLVVAPVDRIDLPAERSLRVSTAIPPQIEAGTTIELQLECDDPDAVFSFVPNTDWLPDESTPILGDLPPRQPSPRLLTLRSPMTDQQEFVMLTSYTALANVELPFRLRVHNEVMQVTGYDKTKMIVRRTNPVGHSTSARVAVVDAAGNSLMDAPVAAAAPGKRLGLAASVNSQQTEIFLSDLDPLSGEALPLQVQLGDEKMTVTAVSDFRTSVTVERANGVAHSVTSDFWLLAAETPGGKVEPALPVVERRTFRWTPSADQLGSQRIRMRATSGTVTHEWFWETTVSRAAAEFPFRVVGIEPDPDSSHAVVWGQSALTYLNPSAATSNEPVTYFVGLYDVAEKTLLRHEQIAKPIMAATIDSTGIYAVLTAFDIEPKADRTEENNRMRASRQLTPTQIVRLDLNTLKVRDQIAVPQHCARLEVIAGKYLAAFGRWRNETFRFELPSLKPVEPPIGSYHYAIAGRLKDGVVWDGIVWDERMRKPQLLLFPVHFERAPGAHSKPQMMAAAGGTILMGTTGPYTCTWFPGNTDPTIGRYLLQNFPGGLDCSAGILNAYSWAASSKPRVGNEFKPKSVKLLDLASVTVAGSRIDQRQRTIGYVSEANGTVHAAALGQLFAVPLDQLIPSEDAFRFIEQQKQFVLPQGKPAELSYSAPGAAVYHLQIWYQRPSFADDEPAYAATSADGTFQLAADTIQVASGNVDADYVSRITPVFQQLTGRRPRGYLAPIYVSVVAEHQDGQQKAGLAHSYLIEIPEQRR